MHIIHTDGIDSTYQKLINDAGHVQFRQEIQVFYKVGILCTVWTLDIRVYVEIKYSKLPL